MTFALLALTLAASSGPQSWTFETGASPKVTAANIAGPITVVAAPGNQAYVEADWRGASDADRSTWNVEVKGSAGELSARVCCGPCRDEHQSCHDAPPIALTLRVPPQSSLRVHQVSGRTRVDGISGEIELHTVSGKAHVGGSAGRVSINTVSGDVELQPAKVAETRLHSVSGDLSVQLPSGSGAQAELQTVSGKLNGSAGGMGRNSRTIGSGGPEISANTVSGDLEVK